jgi:hypothetical protein
LTKHKKIIEKEKEKQEELQFLDQWNKKMNAMKEDEKDELTDIKNRNKNLQSYHKFQMDIKRKKAEEDFKENIETSIKTKLMLQNEQDEFLRYAEKWIHEYHNDGKNIIPMLLDLKQYKRKIYREA